MAKSALPASVLTNASGRGQQVPPKAFRPLAAQLTTVMAGRQSGWSQAALLQILLGLCLTVMPPIQARSLRFVTLVMGDGVTYGFAKAERAKAGW